MFSRAFPAAVLLAASTLVSAQTFTSCNPLTSTCPPDPAFGANGLNCDFTQGPCDAFHLQGSTSLSYSGKGANFVIKSESDSPTIISGQYLFFGRVDLVLQAALGQGIVTSAVLQSDDLDEIDWEFLGGDNSQVQSNYFSKGDTTTYDRAAFHSVGAPLTSYHKYSVVWTSTAVTWLIDDNAVRTLNAADVGSKFPQTPMQVKLGTWVGGGANSPPGTVEWAGGYTNFNNAPFLAYYKSITIVDYAGKDGPSQNSNVKEYVYSDNSGSWQSIDVKGGDGSNVKNPPPPPPHTTTHYQPPPQAVTSTKVPVPVVITTSSAQPTTTVAPEPTTTTEPTTTSVPKPTTKIEETSTSTTSQAPETTVKTTEVKETTTTEAPPTTFKSVTTTKSPGSTTQPQSSTPAPPSAPPKETISTVPTNAASHMATNLGAAVAGLVALMLLV